MSSPFSSLAVAQRLEDNLEELGRSEDILPTHDGVSAEVELSEI